MTEASTKPLSGRRGVIAMAAICCFVAVQPASAQILYGSIVGNVKDPSDAPVPGAAVSVVDRNTNLTRQTMTNEVGAYNLPTLPPGSYDVTVSKEGFHSFTRTGVEVSVDAVVRVDVGLQVGSMTESVTVAASAATLQTDRAEVRSELGSKTLQSAPLAVGRNYQQMFLTIPGMNPPSNASSIPGSPARPLETQVNGTTSNSAVMRIDGATNTNVFMSHVAAYVPAIESVETVNVVTSSFDAEQGLASGASVNVQIKSGTNQLHGSAFEYHTNNNLKAKPFFNPPGAQNPKWIINEFGGTLGGPIIRNKLFYFTSVR